ncbi:facilitated trehalose transporter Tret1-like [Macrosteles quadrilineatus]|uniref:facilitated trehalose transporter Tret1-like n=1 Tax=Macrosteles quadrilineatus TaxID=74068 RepID=UPI0023E0E4C9|nr:facilitated trehalose transporter Tret1-like [Macrosteles quadrilineatus]
MNLGIWRQYSAAFIASLSVLMAGTSYGWINPLLVRLLASDSELPMTADQSSWVVALIELGDLFSPLPAAYFVDTIGRKPLLLYTSPMYIVSWILVLTTRSLPILYFVRILQGFGMGIVYTVLPMYLGEIAEPKIRGAISTFFEGMWCLGILLEYCLGPSLSYQELSAASLVVPVVFLITFIFMPESPYFFAMVRDRDQAEKSLAWLRGHVLVEEELKEIEESVENEMKSQKQSWKDVFATRVNRRAFFIVQVATITKFMSGIGAVLSYSSQTFNGATRSFLTPDQFTILMGSLILLSTLAASFFVDGAGRRPLILLSAAGCGVFELLAALYYYLDERTTVDVSSYSWVAFGSVAAYCVVFSLGVGPLVPVLQAELFPSNTRGMASAITTLTDTFASLLCMKLYEVIASNFGVYLNYLIYAGFSLCGLAVMYFILPETKGRSFVQIQADLAASMDEKKKMIRRGSVRYVAL